MRFNVGSRKMEIARKIVIDNNNNNNATQQPTLAIAAQSKSVSSTLPGDLQSLGIVFRNEIIQYLSLDDKYALSRVDRSLNEFFKEPADQFVNQFLTHVVRGEKPEVEAMLQRMIERVPHLLLEKRKVKDEAGRTIYGTAYQIALGAKDVSREPQKYEEMVEMLERYLKLLPDGEQVLIEQYNEQFPEGFEQQEEERRKNDTAALHKVFAALKNATTEEAAKPAIDEFQAYLKKQTEAVISTGYHFNEKLFEEALELFNSHYLGFGGYSGFKNQLSGIAVLGGIQKYFTANLAQAACDGFGKLLIDKEPLSRSKLLRDGISFFDANFGISNFVYPCYDEARLAWSACPTYDYPQDRGALQSGLRFFRDFFDMDCRSRAWYFFGEALTPMTDYISKFILMKNNNLSQRRDSITKQAETRLRSFPCGIQ